MKASGVTELELESDYGKTAIAVITVLHQDSAAERRICMNAWVYFVRTFLSFELR